MSWLTLLEFFYVKQGGKSFGETISFQFSKNNILQSYITSDKKIVSVQFSVISLVRKPYFIPHHEDFWWKCVPLVCSSFFPYLMVSRSLFPYLTVCRSLFPYLTVCSSLFPCLKVPSSLFPYLKVCSSLFPCLTVCSSLFLYITVLIFQLNLQLHEL